MITGFIYLIGLLFFLGALFAGVVHLKVIKEARKYDLKDPVSIFLTAVVMIIFSAFGIIMSIVGMAISW